MNLNDTIAAVQAAIAAGAGQRRARPANDPIFDQLLAQKNSPTALPTQPNPIQRRMGAANAGPTTYSNGNYRGAMNQGNPDTQHVDPTLMAAVNRMIKDSGNIGINSGYRDNVRQTSLYNDALAKYGNAHDAGAWVAPPGHSPHNKGEAIDLNLKNAAAIAYAHANAAKYGLVFPLANENWHIERKGWRQSGT